MGAEKLLGKGDMLIMFPGAVHIRRVHGAFVDDLEVKRVVQAIKATSKPQYDQRILEMCEKALTEEGKSDAEAGGGEELEYDEFYDKAVELVMEKGSASTSMIQRVFRIGYNRAARIIEVMERDGIIGPMDGVKPREVLVQSVDELASGEGSS
jgi:S-DNA-T family DNA segregation ATPase FtsK/SpoIIIE